MCKCDRMATLNKSLAFHRANMERQAILHTYNLDSCLCTEGLIQSEHSGKHTFPHSIRCKEWYYFCICSKYEATGRLAWLSLSSVGFRDLAFIPSMVEMLKTCPVFSVTAEAWHAWNMSVKLTQSDIFLSTSTCWPCAVSVDIVTESAGCFCSVHFHAASVRSCELRVQSSAVILLFLTPATACCCHSVWVCVCTFVEKTLWWPKIGMPLYLLRSEEIWIMCFWKNIF